MRSILIVVRTESDFERAIPIGIEVKKSFKPVFIFIGDFSPFFNDGISNIFQKNIFQKNNFEIRDFPSFDFFTNFLGWLLNYRSYKLNSSLILYFCIYKILLFYLKINKNKIVNKIFKKINPSYVLTDQSLTGKDYLIEILRQNAISKNIPVYLFTHGAAGGLHAVFTNPKFLEYKNCNVIVCNKNETNKSLKNRIIIGDLSSSYNYVHYLNKLNDNSIDFFNERKYKIGIMIGGTALHTSTSGWKTKEEIIIDFSDNKDVAFVIKIHPRDLNLSFLDMVKNFNNVLIVGNDIDRSRVTKWADIVITNDHCSTVFEPMILGKKVVVIETKKIPKFKNICSPLIESSVNYLKNSKQFEIDNLSNVEKEDKITNQIAWGENGAIDLVELFVNKYLI
jgi:hypothetical protein